jgi:hypothetical protein
VAPSRSSAVREIKSLRSGAEGERSNQQEMAAIGYREGGKSIPRQSGRSKWKVEVEGRAVLRREVVVVARLWLDG